MQFEPLYFFLALLIGFFVVYVFAPEPKTVIKRPTAESFDNTTYVDDNNVCYRYKKESTECPLDDSAVDV